MFPENVWIKTIATFVKISWKKDLNKSMLSSTKLNRSHYSKARNDQRTWLVFYIYLVAIVLLILFEAWTIITVLQGVTLDPEIVKVRPLCRNTHNSCLSTKVDLKPWVLVVRFWHPRACLPGCPFIVKSGINRGQPNEPRGARGGCYRVIWYSAAFHSQRFSTTGDLGNWKTCGELINC